ncbi:MAG: type IX secretion system outer membrane channel protein PorV [bacterium]
MKSFLKTTFVCAVLAWGTIDTETARAQGESAVPFLLIAPNSRAAGIGETGTGSVDDASAIFWNPGALAFMTGQEVTLTHANWLPQFGLSDLFYEYANYRNNIDEIGGTVGASVTYLNLGEFIRTNSSGIEEGRFKAYELAVTLGYSTRVFSDLGLGINARYIRSALSPLGTAQEQGSGIANTVSFDLGMMWRPYDLDIAWLDKKFSFGFNLSNLGPKVTYIDAAQADPLPTNLRLGFGYKLLEDEFNSLTYSVDFSRLLVRRRPEIIDSTGGGRRVIQEASVDPLPKSLFSAWGDGSGLKKVNMSMGAEYWYGSPRLIAIRVGHFFEDPSFGNRNFWTFGAGLRYDIFGFDFSYISAAEGHPLSDTIRFSLLIGWGNSAPTSVPN